MNMLKKAPTWLLIILALVLIMYVFPGIRARIMGMIPMWKRPGA